MKKILGILGGMGPQATIDFQQKVFNLTIANKDQEHIRVITDNNPQIPDRSMPILTSGISPVHAMQKSLNKLVRAGAQRIAMPCVTAHHYYNQLVIPKTVDFLYLPDIAAAACQAEFPGKTAGLLCTHGTAKSGVLTKALDNYGVQYLVPNEGRLHHLAKIIARVKAKDISKETARQFTALAGELAELKVDYFLLACTELPLIVEAHNFAYPCVDAAAELAKAAIKSCGYVYPR